MIKTKEDLLLRCLCIYPLNDNRVGRQGFCTISIPSANRKRSRQEQNNSDNDDNDANDREGVRQEKDLEHLKRLINIKALIYSKVFCLKITMANFMWLMMVIINRDLQE